MQPLQRTTMRSARRLRPQAQRTQRRYAGDSQGAHEKFEPHGGPNQHPTNETFGPGFYITLAAIPASYAIYKFTRAGTEENNITRYLQDKYNQYSEKFTRTNDLHTKALEAAAADRVLFLNESNQQPKWVDVRFPEQLNGGCPWNVPAGQGYANVDKAIAKFQKENYEANEMKLQQLRDNKVPCELPLGSLAKSPPAPPSGA